jgi:hypothetical protein
LSARWKALQGRLDGDRLELWRTSFAAMSLRSEASVAAGTWRTGPSDTLGVLGRDRDELSHSRMLGWLLDPLGQHGLGSTFLAAFAGALCQPLIGSCERAAVYLEMSRGESRADIVIQLPQDTIVIENKVDAGEQADQCLRLANDHPDGLLVFLTPSGKRPTTAGTSLYRWKSLSWRQLGKILTAVLPGAVGPGRSATIDYNSTLKRLFG